jgi:glycosyltransferase involved in cell wall biosynthesis
MKVCVVAGRKFFHPFDQRLYKEMTALRDGGFDVTLVTPDPEPGETMVNGIPVVKVSTKGRGPTAKRMVEACKKIDCDVYHAHEFDGGYVGATLKVLTGKRLFYDVHDEVPAIMAEIKNNPKLERVYDPIEKQILRAMDGVILAEDSYRERYDKLHSNTEVIHNYPMMELFQHCRLEGNKIMKPPVKKIAEKLADKFTVGYVGGLSVRRGLLVMLEAMKELEDEEDINLLLIGDIDREADRKKYTKLVKKYKLEDRIINTKWVEYRELPQYLDLMDVGLVLVQPLRRLQGITPTKLFEYMACGKPVIGSKLPGLERIVLGSKCGMLVEHDNSRMLADNIRSLHGSSDLCEKLGTRGYNAVRDKYNWEMEAKKLIQFYNKFE